MIRQPEKRNCKWCNSEFEDNPENHPNSPHFKRQYCGEECRVAGKSAHLRKMAELRRKPDFVTAACICVVCKKSFEVVLKRSNNYKKRLTCSNSCHAQLRHRKMRKQLVCHCGQVFTTVSPRQTTCSRHCLMFHQRDKINARRRDINYDLAPGEYDKMFSEQNGVCMICLQPETVLKHGKVAALAVDHCHDTGKVRGLLCNNCNTALGKLKHNLIIVGRVRAYLLRSNPLPKQHILHAKYLEQDPLT